MQLWQFLATNAQTDLNGEVVNEVNGLPQGSLLSPLLFNLYLNELLESTRGYTDLRVIAYADDLIVFSPKLSRLEWFMNVARSFFDRRLLRLNESKSDFVDFGLIAKR